MVRHNEQQNIPPLLGALWKIIAGTEALPSKGVMQTVFSEVLAVRRSWGREEINTKETYMVLEALLIGGQNYGDTARAPPNINNHLAGNEY